MENEFIAWTSDLPLSELTLFRDWDYSASSFASLDYYWREFGTVPHWNLALCGGTPALSNPNSSGFTFHSLLAYMFSPNVAFLVLWIIVVAAGSFCIFKLLKRWGISPFGATAGVVLFSFSGFFASHFNQGHHGFVFFNLVPILMLLFDMALAAIEGHKSYFWPAIGITLVTWIMFTGAIPHSIFHFYPGLLLFLILRFFVLARRTDYRRALLWQWPPLAAHILGIVIAFYKLGSVMAWQMAHPRTGVAYERITLFDLFEATQRLVPDYFNLTPVFPQQVWGYWEYNNYIGPVPALLVMFALVVLTMAVHKYLRPRGGQIPFSYGIVLGAMLLFFGTVMSLGNDHPLSPARLLRYLPFVNGIRVFTRYQIMSLFGIIILVGYAFTIVELHIQRLRLGLRLIFAIKVATLLAICLPALYQAGLLVWNVKALPTVFFQRRFINSKGSHRVSPCLSNPRAVPIGARRLF